MMALFGVSQNDSPNIYRTPRRGGDHDFDNLPLRRLMSGYECAVQVLVS